MMDPVKDYLLRVIAAAVICAMARSLLGNRGTASAMARLAAGVILTLVVWKPILSLRMPEDLEFRDFSWPDTASAVEAGVAHRRKQEAAFIREQTQAYIRDKAASMGLVLTVEAELTSEDPPTPAAVTLTGSFTRAQRAMLTATIREELGIGEEAQEWILQP